MIGDRLRQKRIMNGLSLQDLAEKLALTGRTLTRAMLSKYELNQATPNALVLRDLANVLGVKTDYFFTESSINIVWKAFRKKASVSQIQQDRLKMLAQQAVEQFVCVENACGIETRDTDLPVYRAADNPDEAEFLAEELRLRWELGNMPIKSLSELLESKGFILVSLASPVQNADGLVGTFAGNRKIVVYANEKSVDRTRLTMAHELGHLLIGNDDSKLNEKLANRFAGAFLAPATLLRQDMGKSRRSFSIPELCLLKEKYGISIQSLTYRAKDLGILTESAYKSMFISFRRQGIGTMEPGTWPYEEEPKLIKHYIFRAVAEGRISESNAIELYPEYLEEKTGMESLRHAIVRTFMDLPVDERNRRLMAAAESAFSFYEANGELSGFDMIDDVEDYE